LKGKGRNCCEIVLCVFMWAMGSERNNYVLIIAANN
jgi:hypothetical protein